MTWDKTIAEQKKIQGEKLSKLISDVAELLEIYGDDYFDN